MLHWIKYFREIKRHIYSTSYKREIKDLTFFIQGLFFCKALYGLSDLFCMTMFLILFFLLGLILCFMGPPKTKI